MATRILYHFLGPLPEADALCSINSETYSITSSLNEYLEQHGELSMIICGRSTDLTVFSQGDGITFTLGRIRIRCLTTKYGHICTP